MMNVSSLIVLFLSLVNCSELLAPALIGAQINAVHRDALGGVQSIEVQTTHVVREYPDAIDEKQPPKKALLQHQYISNRREDQGFDTQIVGTGSVADGSVVFQKYSPTFSWSVKAIKRAGEGGKLSYFLQVFKTGRYYAEYAMTVHGEFSSDELFGWTGWNEEKGLFIYQAEELNPNPDHKWNPSFGETFSTKHNVGVYILNLKDGNILAKLGPTDKFVITSIMYHEENEELFFVGNDVLPKRLGVAYVYNRPCSLYKWSCKEDEAPVRLTFPNQVQVIHYPKLDTVRDRIVFFGTYEGGSHSHAFSYHSISVSGDASSFTTLIDDVNMPMGEVPGLFPIFNPQQELSVSGLLFYPSYVGTEVRILKIDTLSGTCSIVASPFDDDVKRSWQVYQVLDNVIIASWSTRASTPSLMLGLNAKDGIIEWHSIDKDSIELSNVQQSVYHVSKYIDIVLASPKGTDYKKLPLIIHPHGGPNMAYTAEYLYPCHLAASKGYAIASSTQSPSLLNHYF